MFEEVLSLPLSKHCKNDFSSSKKPKHPFPLHTAAQGQDRGAKLLHTLPVLKITLTHFSTSHNHFPTSGNYSGTEMAPRSRTGLGQEQQDLSYCEICEGSVRAELLQGSGENLGDTDLSELPGGGWKGRGREV